MLIMKLAFSSHLLFMLLDFGTLLLFTYHFHIDHILYLEFKAFFISCERFISKIEAICRQWMSDGPKNLLEKGATLLEFSKVFKKKKWMEYYAKLGDLLYINGLGGFFFFFVWERESFNLASAPDNSSLSSDQDTNWFLVQTGIEWFGEILILCWIVCCLGLMHFECTL